MIRYIFHIIMGGTDHCDVLSCGGGDIALEPCEHVSYWSVYLMMKVEERVRDPAGWQLIPHLERHRPHPSIPGLVTELMEMHLFAVIEGHRESDGQIFLFQDHP
eukprot:CAMPEP_0182430442 /NCGR_PEP_ID=MMETSP1167-20130531/40626_1 /TAXON_ID=2988 /ORGANISM="Mallomonas Sp, Strain CCMP3275" /LENGTH=103 /DNA_ID=CAMNT_0024615545 /DNA_START=284 /DNA_END=591 /DNA_ORIENTATION=+